MTSLMVTGSIQGLPERRKQMIAHHGHWENDQTPEKMERILLNEFWTNAMEKEITKKVLKVNIVN